MVDMAPLQVEIIPSVKYRQVLPKSLNMQLGPFELNIKQTTCLCKLSLDDIDEFDQILYKGK